MSEPRHRLQSSRLLLEVEDPHWQTPQQVLDRVTAQLRSTEGLEQFSIDPRYPAVPMNPSPTLGSAQGGHPARTWVLRLLVTPDTDRDAVRRLPGVVGLWSNPRIGPGTVDCGTGTVTATTADVLDALGASRVWTRHGTRGAGIGIGIVDGGITAYPVQGGWSPLPGRPPGGTPAAWPDHADMCAHDALIACPDAGLYDYAIGLIDEADPFDTLLDAALIAFDEAIRSFLQCGNPQVLSNSWMLYTEADESFPPGHTDNYSRNPRHPFTRKVLEAIDAGLLVVFAAGNCGSACPSRSCGADAGPGRGIWGANGHARVVTVGAANPKGDWIDYSSQGPSSLAAEKPDVCGYSEFLGPPLRHSGTSAACAVVSGVAALLKAVNPALRQSQLLELLRDTAVNPVGNGWNPRFGCGLVDADAAARAT